jgi:putative MFS transporter
MKKQKTRPSPQALGVFNANVIVASLGYFVDIYDLLIFGIVRVPSLRAMGVAESALLDNGLFLINLQMIGMLFGGLLWGVLGDKKGRLSVLFASIALYSVANILNAFATTVPVYGALRFLAGVGLAGELGAAITLVSETLSTEKRGYGTTTVAAIGILGAVFAGLIAEYLSWKSAYLIGGGLGLALLALRISMFESGLFSGLKEAKVRKGDLRMLFAPKRFFKYINCILIGVPVWFVVGILVTFSPEISRELHVTDLIVAGKSIMFCYAGVSAGDVASGLLSQYFRSRRGVIAVFLAMTAVWIGVYLFSEAIFGPLGAFGFYAICAVMGFSTGYWALFITVAAEQFGTNLRATVATSVPNFVRASVVPLTMSFKLLSGHVGLRDSALIVGAVSMLLAFVSLHFMKETFSKDLNYLED